MAKMNLEQLRKLREDKKRDLSRREVEGKEIHVIVGMGTCGIAAGASKTYRALEDELAKQGQSVSLRTCGCLGMCHAEPLVEVCIEGLPRVVYCRVTEECAREIVRGHVMGRKLLQD